MPGATPILIAEDDPNDAFLLKRILEKYCKESDVHLVNDGEEAIAYLAGEGEFADRERHPLPEFVLTDIKMPKKDGFEVLDWLKQHPQCRLIPVIVWSSSGIASDVTRAYELGANCYFQKPVLSEDWQVTIELIVRFWKAAQKPSMNLVKCAEKC